MNPAAFSDAQSVDTEHAFKEFADNGRGMRDETRAHMFDPFFTTRRSDGGTGLGLSLVYGIVYDHGGTLEVISNQDQGTRVIVELPLSPAPAEGDIESG